MINYEVLLTEFELFVLILVRLASFVSVAPFFNTANTPVRLFAMTMLVYSLHPDMSVTYNNVIEYAGIVLMEVAVGLILGAATAFCVQIIIFAGKIIDMDIGISMAQIYDPTTRTQVGIMGNFYYYLVMLILIVSGLHRYLVAAIVETFNAIPVGGVKFEGTILDTVIDFMADYFIIGFRIVLPVFAAMLLLNCILAILAKIAPQMNMFVVGMQLKLFVGILVIFVTVGMIPAISTMLFNEIKTIMSALVRGMS